MTPKERSISTGIKLAVRHPETGAALLAQTLTAQMNGARWIDRDMRMQFCIRYLGSCIDGVGKRSAEPALLRRLKGKPLSYGIRLLKRNPDEGLKALVALVREELCRNQQATTEEQVRFCEELLVRFFPEAEELTAEVAA